MNIWEASIVSVVEGLTEYLPISSTGHIILTMKALGIEDTEFTKYFTVMVQFGAIVAVAVEYFRMLIRHWKLYPILLAAFLPAAVIGLALHKKIHEMLGSLWVVGITFVVGGVVLIFTDRIFKPNLAKHKGVHSVSYVQAVKIGFFQCLSLLPGMSRSASTIWGGLFVGMDQRTATEFSFLLALPTLTAAAFYEGFKGYKIFTPDDWKLLLWCNVISFAVGWITIRSFIHYVSRHSFRAFGYYRVVVGTGIMLFLLIHGS